MHLTAAEPLSQNNSKSLLNAQTTVCMFLRQHLPVREVLEAVMFHTQEGFPAEQKYLELRAADRTIMNP